MSKWLDAVTHTGVFHMQQSHYDKAKPPSYYDHNELNFMHLKRDREVESEVRNRKKKKEDKFVRSFSHSIEHVQTASDSSGDSEFGAIVSSTSTARHSSYLMSMGRLDGGWGLLADEGGVDGEATFYNMHQGNDFWESQGGEGDKGFASSEGGRTPTLFLQELVHLASLLNAVAFSTLRNDMEGSSSPLDYYVPGSPWPNDDPDKDPKTATQKFWDPLRYLTGFDKSPSNRTRHNMNRPLPVLGGVSENEIKFLRKARGPSAKVTLAWHWLSEFIIREHLAGSLGDVAPPIISRLIQFLSDGMIYYNHARKTMYIPFPFPHAQISAVFILVIMFAVPLLMDEYSKNIYLGAILTFLTVSCLAGLHEVGRELENPFRNIPNEIPLCTLQAMFNESLVTLYSGYHPDHYWNADDYKRGMYINDDKGMNGSNGKRGGSSEVPQATEEKEVRKAVNVSDLTKIVETQQKEIERLSALIEGKNLSNCLP